MMTHFSTIFVVFFLSLTSTLNAQKVTCKSFHTGTYQNVENGQAMSRIYRSQHFQTEKMGKIKIKLEVIWIDDCNYRLKFIKGNKAFWKTQTSQETPDMLVKIVSFTENSYFQESYLVNSPDNIYKSTFYRLN